MPAEHPQIEQLSAFALGKLESVALDAIESHLAECPSCCDTLNQIKEDTFVGIVRGVRDDEAIANDERPKGDTALKTDTDRSALPLAEAGTAAQSSPAPGLQTATEPAAAIPVAELPIELANHAKFRVVDLLGAGGMGAVYKAEHRMMKRTVALKVINPKFMQSRQAVERFHREVQAAARLHHPNIVTAHDAEQAGGLHYLVMEYVPGIDLQKMLEQRGPLPVAEACEYIRQAALGMQHAHENGMVHRDIKPQNLMLSVRSDRLQAVSATRPTEDGHYEQGIVKILDFGLASLTEAPVEEATESSTVDGQKSGLTQAGALMGTPDYMAPEQAKDARTADIRADIYSLGCTLYALLAGKVPFPGGTAIDKVIAHSTNRPRSLREVRKDVPAALVKVLDRMLAKEPAQRYQTPAEVAAALAPLSPMGRRVGGEGRSRRRLLVSFLSAAAALLLGGIIWVTTDSGWLKIQTSADIQVEISKDGKVEVLDVISGTTVKRLASGDYQIKLKGDRTDVRLDSKGGFTITRWRETVVKASLEPKPPTPLSPEGPAQAKALQSAWAKNLGVDVEIVNSVGMKMRLIPPGEFMMGTGGEDEKKLRDDMARFPELEAWSDAPDTETPQHLVKLTKPFRIAAHEVTVAQFRRFVEATNYKTDAEKDGKGGQIIDATKNAFVHDAKTNWQNPGPYKAQDNYPVTQVSWNDAAEFCKWLSKQEGVEYRLPTEAEWEFVCRAGSIGRYSFGDNAAEFHQWGVVGKQSPEPVGSRKPNAFGIHDMEGNAWEWCADWFQWHYHGWTQVDPTGPETSATRAQRGGAFNAEPLLCRPALRWGYVPTFRTLDAGFRAVMGGDLRAKAINDEQRIQGAWNCVAVESQGTQRPEAFVKGNSLIVTFQGNAAILKPHRAGIFFQLDVIGSFQLDPTKNPKTIDIVDPESGRKIPGIYGFEGDALKLCFATEPSRVPERPADFTTKPGSLNFVFIFKRVQVEDGGVKSFHKDDAADIQGTWTVTAAEALGQPVPQPIIEQFRPTLTLRSGSATWKINPPEAMGQLKLSDGLERSGLPKELVPFLDKLFAAGKAGAELSAAVKEVPLAKWAFFAIYNLNPTVTPKRIDVMHQFPKSMLGIYTLDAVTLKVCMTIAPDQPGEWPAEFTTKGEVLRVMLTLKRQPTLVAPEQGLTSKPPPQAGSETEEGKLQGTWKSIALTAVHTHVTIDGNRFVLKHVPKGPDPRPEEIKTVVDGNLQFDASASPPRLKVVNPKNNATLLIGIYRLQADTLSLCFKAPPKDDKYPTSFATDPPSGAEFVHFKRSAAPAAQTKNDKQLIQGVWLAVAAEVAGEAVPEEILKTMKPTITFGPDKVTAKPEPLVPKQFLKIAAEQGFLLKEVAAILESGVEGVYEVDQTKSPKTININYLGPVRKTILGIYTLDGDMLKICATADPVRVDQRPTEFSTKAGQMRGMVTLQRQPPATKDAGADSKK